MGYLSSTVTNLLNRVSLGTKRAGLGDIINDLYARHLSPSPGRTVTADATVLNTDVSTVIRANSSSGINLTIPADATGGFVGDVTVSAYQVGTGAVAFVAGAGVTLRNPTGLPTAVQYGLMRATRVGANEWILRR